MNSGHSTTKLNDMLVEFTNYVNHMKTGKRVSKVDILGAIYDYLHEITARNDDHFTWGDGDSLDRERVRDILVLKYGYDKNLYGGSILL